MPNLQKRLNEGARARCGMAKLSRNWGYNAVAGLLLIVLFGVVVSRNPLRTSTRMSATVRGLSMSPTYRCSRFEIKCTKCSSVFSVAAEVPTGDRIENTQSEYICPWCSAVCHAATTTVMPGEVVDIRPLSDSTDIRRFDVVAFERLDVVRIKRVIGLPGERIEIDDGDIFINDERLRKTLQQFMDTAIVVADSRFCSDGLPWVAEGGWRFSDGAWHSPNAALQSRLVFTPATVVPGQLRSTPRIMNYNAFDQRTPRSLCDVGDVLVLLELDVRQLSQLEVVMHDGWQEWTCDVSRIPASRPSVSRFALQLQSEMGTAFNSEFVIESLDDLVEMHFGCVDQRIVLNVTDTEAFSIPFHLDSSTRSMEPHPIWIRSASGSAIIDRLIVRRDLHYLPNAIDDVPDSTAWQLEAGQYFVLGDYSPVSVDSRSPKIGPVSSHEIIGTVVRQQ